MERQEESRVRIRALLDSQKFAVLCTQSETGPYCSLVAFWAADDLSHVVFATLRASRKFGFLSARPRVAMLFDDRVNRDADVRDATAVTAVGVARETAGQDERSGLAAAFVARHPGLASFVASAGCALVRVEVEAFTVVTRFQDVTEVRIDDETRSGAGGPE